MIAHVPCLFEFCPAFAPKRRKLRASSRAGYTVRIPRPPWPLPLEALSASSAGVYNKIGRHFRGSCFMTHMDRKARRPRLEGAYPGANHNAVRRRRGSSCKTTPFSHGREVAILRCNNRVPPIVPANDGGPEGHSNGAPNRARARSASRTSDYRANRVRASAHFCTRCRTFWQLLI